MSFQCFLDRSAFSVPHLGLMGASDGQDDYQISVVSACRVLAGSGLRFQFSGFGLADWNLGIQYDLSAFMEKLPEMLKGIAVDQMRKVGQSAPGGRD
ncbi:hypothetical protein [Actinomadura flavalba]|uniref:hypothetical protein n=1 Tax=Actinomadura flavalba TaxID=1120938 RepID=UPI00036341DD|nr:hypothetical protein [Actinomadura flavalba]